MHYDAYEQAQPLLPSSSIFMIKKRTRPNPRVREISNEVDEDNIPENDDEVNMPYVTCDLPTRFN